jgi:hypothetical protein
LKHSIYSLRQTIWNICTYLRQLQSDTNILFEMHVAWNIYIFTRHDILFQTPAYSETMIMKIHINYLHERNSMLLPVLSSKAYCSAICTHLCVLHFIAWGIRTDVSVCSTNVGYMTLTLSKIIKNCMPLIYTYGTFCSSRPNTGSNSNLKI